MIAIKGKVATRPTGRLLIYTFLLFCFSAPFCYYWTAVWLRTHFCNFVLRAMMRIIGVIFYLLVK